jgi:hypothetical protein
MHDEKRGFVGSWRMSLYCYQVTILMDVNFCVALRSKPPGV